MVNEIRADYQALAALAARFTSRAQVTQEMANSVQRAYEPLAQGSWIGKGADAFFAEMRGEVMPAVGRLIAALTMAGEITNALSQLMQEADNAAAAPYRAGLQEERSAESSGSGGGSGGGSGSGSGGGSAPAEMSNAAPESPAESPGGGSGSGSGGGMEGGTPFGSSFDSPFAAGSFDSGLGAGSFGMGSLGGGGFGGGGFGSGFGGDAFGAAESAATGAGTGAPSQFRYQPSGVGGGAGSDANFSRPYAGGGIADSATKAPQGGFAVLSSLLAASPFLATMVGKFGKKRNEE